jgi:hypothetical protein
LRKEGKITRKREIFEERSSFFFGSCPKQVPFYHRSPALHEAHKISRGKSKFYSIEKRRKLTEDLNCRNDTCGVMDPHSQKKYGESPYLLGKVKILDAVARCCPGR